MFISCDWGTSTFRLRLLESSAGTPSAGPRPATAKVLATLSTNAGIATTHALWQHSGLPETERMAFYRAVLEKSIDQLAASSQTSGEPGIGIDLHGVPVIISGMASSSIGMLELPYKPLPFDVSGIDLTPAVLPAAKGSPRILYLMPGVRSADDVMRGEETQLIGCCVNRPDFGFDKQVYAVNRPDHTIHPPGQGVFVFPGTHSKHIDVRDGQATAFKTYITGELFALLTQQSVLAASVTAPGKTGSAGGSATLLPEAFFAGIAASCETSLLHSAFLTRTNQLFHKYNKEDNYHFLSGLLIGEELRDIADPPKPQNAPPLPRPATLAAPSPRPEALTPSPAPGPGPVTLVASSPLRESYAAALDFLGLRQVAAIDADEALIAGHCAIFARFGATIAP
jgi:2-dehydro-3-deoxygalactonokinase